MFHLFNSKTVPFGFNSNHMVTSNFLVSACMHLRRTSKRTLHAWSSIHFTTIWNSEAPTNIILKVEKQSHNYEKVKSTNTQKEAIKHLGLFTLNALLLLKFLLRKGPRAAFRAASDVAGNWLSWKFDLLRARASCQIFPKNREHISNVLQHTLKCPQASTKSKRKGRKK